MHIIKYIVRPCKFGARYGWDLAHAQGPKKGKNVFHFGFATQGMAVGAALDGYSRPWGIEKATMAEIQIDGDQ